MRVPSSTYRLQLRAEFGFPDGAACGYAAALLPAPPTDPFMARLTQFR